MQVCLQPLDQFLLLAIHNMKYFLVSLLGFAFSMPAAFCQDDTLHVDEDTVEREPEMEFIKRMECDETCKKLENDFKSLTNDEMVINYLFNHAAKYSDFDSLYPIITGEKCPPNYTFNLVHEKLESYPAKVNAAFLSILCRNYIALMSSTGKSEKMHDYNLRYEWFRQHNDELKKMERANFYIPSHKGIDTKFQKMNSPYFLKETVLVKQNDKPINSYADQNMSNFERYYNDKKNNRKQNKGKSLTYYVTSGNLEVETLSGTKLEDNLQATVSSQFFNDVAFMVINGKIVWFDISK
jgi:hypothetical protein